jgi:hypothetical protein
VQVGGFFVTSDRAERQALARFVNELEEIPNTEGGGGGLSPRLEAELIAMLTRPAPPHAMTTERTLTATLFGLIGLVVGGLGVLALVWLNQLAKGVQDQTASLRDQSAKFAQMAESVERASAAQRLALEALLAATSSKEHDPDALLSQVEKTVRDLDEARRKLSGQVTINDALAARTHTLEVTNDKLKDELGHALKYEKDAKDAAALREKVAALESDNSRQAQKLAKQEEVLDTVEGRKAQDLLRRYDRAWYAAVAGWGVALLLALGLLAAFGLKPLPDPAAMPLQPGGDVEETPPHHIP